MNELNYVKLFRSIYVLMECKDMVWIRA